MTLKQLGLRLVLILGVIGMATAGWGQSQRYQVLLGGRALGALDYARSASGAGASQTLSATFDNTPLGVFDGTFQGTSKPVRAEGGDVLLQYLGQSESSRKSRVISVLLDAARVMETVVSPEGERTPLSQAERVPAGVVDPVAAFGRLVGSAGCPEPFTMYDGRRVVEISTQASQREGGTLSCRMDYEVVAGPGHLSPLRFRSLDMELTYDMSGPGGAILREIDIKAGVFHLAVVR